MPWWAPVASSLLAGTLGLIAGLSSVFLTRRFSREHRRDERLENLRLEQRAALVDLIDVVDRWAPMTEVFAMLMAQDKESKSTIEFLSTDSGRELLAASKEIRRVLVECLLTIVDDELRALVVEVDRLVRGREDMHKEVLRLAATDRIGAAGVGMAYAARLLRLNAELQVVGVRRLSAPTAVEPRRS